MNILGGENYGGHFLYMLSTSTHGPEGKALPFPSKPHPRGKALPLLHGPKALGTSTWPCPSEHIHSGLPSLKVSSVPYRAALQFQLLAVKSLLERAAPGCQIPENRSPAPRMLK